MEEKNENICMEEKIIVDVKEAGFVGNEQVSASGIPRYEIFLPYRVAIKLNVDEDDTINFIEENGKIYLEKA